MHANKSQDISPFNPTREFLFLAGIPGGYRQGLGRDEGTASRYLEARVQAMDDLFCIAPFSLPTYASSDIVCCEDLLVNFGNC